jgi:hypothetical protein
MTVAEGDRVVVFVEMTGTHEGPWRMVQEPTHQPMHASLTLGLQIDDDGMIVDSWLGSNFIAMLAQLGWGVAPFGGTAPSPSSNGATQPLHLGATNAQSMRTVVALPAPFGPRKP